ncbi:hypothetical protein ACPV56_05780 [Vibrio astriarenae]
MKRRKIAKARLNASLGTITSELLKLTDKLSPINDATFTQETRLDLSRISSEISNIELFLENALPEDALATEHLLLVLQAVQHFERESTSITLLFGCEEVEGDLKSALADMKYVLGKSLLRATRITSALQHSAWADEPYNMTNFKKWNTDGVTASDEHELFDNGVTFELIKYGNEIERINSALEE